MSENETTTADVETYFLITVNHDGVISTYPEIPEELPTKERTANNYDVYTNSKQIVEEFENSLMAQRVALEVAKMLMPQEETVPDKVKEAMDKRGMNSN